MTVEDLHAWLRGTWAVERSINADGRFDGTAEFSDAGEGRTGWREEGELALAGHRGPATREMTVVAAPDGAPSAVHFDDGGLFHDLDLTSGSWRARHDCGADVYSGEFAVETDERFTVTWRVRGPGRDDTIRSIYTRARST